MEVCIDSRAVGSPGDTLFFALKGKNHNGHDYVRELYGKGVRSFVISEDREEFSALTEAKFFRVEQVLDALQSYARAYREKMKAEVIAVTGSNGKTIVKEWLYQLLSDDYVVYRSPRSYNSQVGVPLSLCGIEESADIAVIEAGISRKGEMVRLENMIRPDLCIFTHLGDAHGENFSSLREKLEEKAILFRYCSTAVGREGQTMDYISATADKKARIVRWGESEQADVRTRVLSRSENSWEVEVAYGKELFTLHLPFGDEASYENCINAVCVLLLKGVSSKRIAEKVSRLQPIAMRMEIKEGINRTILVNDYYNSDIVSFRTALAVQGMQDKSKSKTVILSDVLDTGTEPDTLYRGVAERLEEAGVTLFIGIGEELCKHREYFRMNARFYPDTENFLRQENRNSFRDQVILIKGARRFRFEYIAGFLQKQTHNTVLEVNMDAMVANLNYFRSLLPEHTKLAVMVKAFSYGSGAGEVASLLQYHGVNYLMVAFADEGIALRAEGITIPVAVMNPQPDSFDSMIEFNLEPEIYSPELLAAFDRALVRHGQEKYPVHIKLNTGMNRAGLDLGDITFLREFFAIKRRVEVTSLFSHLAGSDEERLDEFTRLQYRKFREMADEIQAFLPNRALLHILNSAGIERFPEYSCDMVRLGVGLHGISAVGAVLEPVAVFKTYIESVREVKKGETVGYGRRGVAERDSRIAVVPVGYADGLNRRLGNGVGEMWVKGYRVPVIGTICMDTCMLDITDTPAETGEEVEIFGRHIPVTEVAQKLGTIPYEILTGVAYRVKRVYYKE